MYVEEYGQLAAGPCLCREVKIHAVAWRAVSGVVYICLHPDVRRERMLRTVFIKPVLKLLLHLRGVGADHFFKHDKSPYCCIDTKNGSQQIYYTI